MRSAYLQDGTGQDYQTLFSTPFCSGIANLTQQKQQKRLPRVHLLILLTTNCLSIYSPDDTIYIHNICAQAQK